MQIYHDNHTKMPKAIQVYVCQPLNTKDKGCYCADRITNDSLASCNGHLKHGHTHKLKAKTYK